MTKDKEKMASDAAFAEAIAADPIFHFKVASVILGTEEGRAFAQQQLEVAEGAAQAEDIIKAACFMETQAARLLDEEEAGIAAAQEFWKNASTEERAQIEKIASVHNAALATFATDEERFEYERGVKEAAMAQDQGMMGDQLPPGMGDPAGGAGGPPGAGAPPPGGADAGAAPGGAGGGGEISDEDIAMVLQQLIQSGEIDEKTAMDIMQAIQGGGAPGGDAGGAGGPPPGAGAPPDAGARLPQGGPEGAPANRAAITLAAPRQAQEGRARRLTWTAPARKPPRSKA